MFADLQIIFYCSNIKAINNNSAKRQQIPSRSANCGTKDIHCAMKQCIPSHIKCMRLSSPALPWNVHARMLYPDH